MYSILIKVTTSNGNRYKYYTNDDGSIYTESDLALVQAKVVELLQDNLLSSIVVVKNCTITETITIEETEPEENTDN